MTDKDGLHDMPLRLSRRQVISGMASLGVLTGGAVPSAFGQAPKRVIIPEGDFAPLPIAIPNFVAGKAGGGGGGGGGAPRRPPHTHTHRRGWRGEAGGR